MSIEERRVRDREARRRLITATARKESRRAERLGNSLDVMYSTWRKEWAWNIGMLLAVVAMQRLSQGNV